MKKLICLIVTIAILTISIPSMAEEVKKCKLPKGNIIGILMITGQFSAGILAETTTFTILKVTKDVKSLTDKTAPPRDIGEFSYIYDKPGMLCPLHGVDPYETYAPNLGSDTGMLFMDECVE